MPELLRHIDPGYLMMIAFAVGVWVTERRAEKRMAEMRAAYESSRTAAGQRIGALEDKTARLEAESAMAAGYRGGYLRPPPPSAGGGHGR